MMTLGRPVGPTVHVAPLFDVWKTPMSVPTAMTPCSVMYAAVLAGASARLPLMLVTAVANALVVSHAWPVANPDRVMSARAGSLGCGTTRVTVRFGRPVARVK